MPEAASPVPPTLVVSPPGATARLKPGALLREGETAVSRIPYGADSGR